MQSHELAILVSEIHLEARSRIYTTGHDQYADDARQRFENETLQDDLTGLEEELLDAINWSAMTIIKLREAREKANRTLAQSGDIEKELSRPRGLSGKDPEPVITPESLNAHNVQGVVYDWESERSFTVF